MSRPSFQFYHGDWRRNAKLRRCNHAQRGIWLEIMCMMADEDEFGVLRWPLSDVANAVPCRIAELRPLVDRGVIKGAEAGEKCPALIYTPRHAGKVGEPVVLIPEQLGPIWYSSRMVRDTYIASIRGKGTRFGAEPKPAPIDTPTRRIGAGPSSASSSSVKALTPLPPSGEFVRFWEAWPKHSRKASRGKCFEVWKKGGFDASADAIVSHVETLKLTLDWRKESGAYIPAPLVYLNQRRWEGADAVGPAEKRMVM